MGLDMYLDGKKHYFDLDHQKTDEEGYKIKETVIELGYWRKHANLHGYIVAQFGPKDEAGNPIDDCREINLTLENLQHLLEVVKNPKSMPKTTGFFFGESDNDQTQIDDDVAIITRAIGFLTTNQLVPDKTWRTVVYEASW